MDTGAAGLDRTRLAELLRRERAAFAVRHVRSARAYTRRVKLFITASLLCPHDDAVPRSA